MVVSNEHGRPKPKNKRAPEYYSSLIEQFDSKEELPSNTAMLTPRKTTFTEQEANLSSRGIKLSYTKVLT